MGDSPELVDRVRCPCCGYPTLAEPDAYEICELCDWEDDGQSDADADEVWGGPNGSYSLTEARRNFAQYLTIYAPDRDKRLWPDSERGKAAKRALRLAFDRLVASGPNQQTDLTREILQLEAELYEELLLKIRQHETRRTDPPLR